MRENVRLDSGRAKKKRQTKHDVPPEAEDSELCTVLLRCTVSRAVVHVQEEENEKGTQPSRNRWKDQSDCCTDLIKKKGGRFDSEQKER